MTCFECGNPAAHHHHVVPRSLGGTKTIPLCTTCHRKVHSPRQALALGELSHIARARQKLVWVCDICGAPIRDGRGVIELRYEDLARYRAAERSWDRQQPDGWAPRNLSSLPEPPMWRVVHYTCDNDPGAASYWIPVEDIRTAHDALARTQHLAEKRALQPGCMSWHSRIVEAQR